MPTVHPFRAVQYNQAKGDVSDLVAPPYDVLDISQKQALLDKNADNIVGVDLPHVPAKELGPPEAYQGSADKLRAMIEAGTMSQSDAPAWVSTSGLGVSWLHIRIDTRPKYYSYAPFRAFS